MNSSEAPPSLADRLGQSPFAFLSQRDPLSNPQLAADALQDHLPILKSYMASPDTQQQQPQTPVHAYAKLEVLYLQILTCYGGVVYLYGRVLDSTPQVPFVDA